MALEAIPAEKQLLDLGFGGTRHDGHAELSLDKVVLLQGALFFFFFVETSFDPFELFCLK